MCIEYEYGDRTISTVADARDLFGGAIRWDAAVEPAGFYDDPARGDHCLCGLDIAATAAAAGFDVNFYEYPPVLRVHQADPHDDWWPHWTDLRKPFLRHPTGAAYAPQHDLCDDVSHWVSDPNDTDQQAGD